MNSINHHSTRSGVIIRFVDIGLHALRHFPAGEHYPPSTTLALESNVCTQAYDLPVSASTGMRLLQADDVIHSHFGEHELGFQL